MNEFRTFYEGLNQPSFAPAPEVFGIVWGILYILIIAAGVYLFVQAVRGRISAWLFGLYLANLILNLTFTPIELKFGLSAGTGWILLIWLTLLWLLVYCWKQAKPAFWLLVPYFLWGSFATVLQVTLLVLN